MTQHAPLKTLIGLAQDEVEAAAQKLGRAQRERGEAQTQLDALVQYRDEYHARFTQSAQTGMAAGQMRNFQAFIDTLDHAISLQRGQLSAASGRVAQAQPEWQQRKQKLGSYEVLEARGEAALAVRENRREQRDADEHAARIFRSHPNES
ncbi:flagellar export protein FliJ [Paraburkholderia bonniea]|uniref:flagellar export protein FliJ n=1 Tax=Paraburkholderia bonniea TaxID=2152891 RepID=UPI001291E89B|nr:flagellar export protein FliJ [Paraburkholderia bonniea]WJF90466.1 flagellar export protein FliJ [Paraburkholderia bonniea]WJF93781.1 flagellar export protein FliJ [Paraburkholderia bonniea]